MMATTNRMGLANLLAAIETEAWLAPQASVRGIAEGISGALQAMSAADFRDFEKIFTGRSRSRELNMVDGTAVLAVSGVLSTRLSFFEWLFGFFDVLEFQRDFAMAAEDESVESILLHFDSPGGRTTGVHEAARMIADCPKPVAAYCDTMMASGAYYMAAGADRIFMTQSATAGSIGVYMSLLDASRAYASAGLERVLFTTGGVKGAGIEGTPVTAEQREFFQRHVEGIFADFRQHVLDHRAVDENIFNGSFYTGKDAVSLNLADEIGGFDSALAWLASG